LVLLIGMLAMAPIMLLVNRYYKIPLWKVLIILVILTALPYFACKLMFYLENRQWDGQSFFGAVLMAPLLAWLTAKIVREPVSAVMDLHAPAVCIMLAVQKVNCMVAGCCRGKIFAYASNGDSIRFPSQIVEGAVALLLCLFLFWLLDKEKHRGKLLPWFMVLYGVSRFGLNLMRETTPVLWGMAIGNIWSIVSVFIGFVVFALMAKKKA